MTISVLQFMNISPGKKGYYLVYYTSKIFLVLLTMTEAAEGFQSDPLRGEKVDWKTDS